MKLAFLIPTCERPRQACRLVRQVATHCPWPHEFFILNDCSEANYLPLLKILRAQNYTYSKSAINRGKKGYYKTVDKLFKWAEGKEFDYIYKLDDDIVLHPTFFERSLSILQELNNRHRKIVLNLWVDHRADQPIWTNQRPRKVSFNGYKLRKIGWVDGGNWVANQKTFEALGWSCPKPPDKWWESSGDSSGVGKYLSKELIRQACRIYMPMESLIYHGEHKSIMNEDKNNQNRPIEMKNKPWL